MNVQQLIDQLSKVEDKTRKVVCLESDFRAIKADEAFSIREVADSEPSANYPVRLYHFS